MAAVIELRTGRDLADVDPAHLDRGGPGPRPTLRVLDGGRSASSRRMRRVFLGRRLLAASLVLVAVLGVGQLVASAFGGVGAQPLTGPTAFGPTHVVQPGDTLWSLASTIDPDADPRDLVDQILRMNSVGPDALDGTARLRAGQELRLPTAS